MTKRNDSLPSTPTVQVIERMVNLLEVLASREEPVSLKEISEKTGFNPSTAHRILNDLTIGRFVDRPEAGSKAAVIVGEFVAVSAVVAAAAFVPLDVVRAPAAKSAE